MYFSNVCEKRIVRVLIRSRQNKTNIVIVQKIWNQSQRFAYIICIIWLASEYWWCDKCKSCCLENIVCVVFFLVAHLNIKSANGVSVILKWRTIWILGFGLLESVGIITKGDQRWYCCRGNVEWKQYHKEFPLKIFGFAFKRQVMWWKMKDLFFTGK